MKNRLISASSAWIIATAFSLFGLAVQLRAQTTAVPTYTYVDLAPALRQGLPRLEHIGGYAVTGISDSRVVVGFGSYRGATATSPDETVSWRYAAGVATEAIRNGYALGINNAGVIVGRRDTETATFYVSSAIRVESGAVQLIGPSVAGGRASASGISHTGYVAGDIKYPAVGDADAVQQGFRWFQGATTLIGPAAGYTAVSGVNDAGDVVGDTRAITSSQTYAAFVWRNGVLTTLSTPPGGVSAASAINNNGVVIGSYSDATRADSGAAKWVNGVRTRLRDLPGFSSSPSAINDAGVIVGHADAPPANIAGRWEYRAMIWVNDQPLDLNTLVALSAGRRLEDAVAINSSGDVVGSDDRGEPYLLLAGPPTATTNPGRLINLSILSSLAPATETMTVGVVIGGAGTTGTKPLLVRAAGPALTQLGVTGVLGNPKLDFFNGATKVGENDDWNGDGQISGIGTQVGAFPFASTESRDAALYNATTARGDSSVRISAVGGTTGRVIAELYDATPAGTFSATTPRLINVSVLKGLGTGLTAGFVIGGATPRTILVRAVGPTLGAAPFGVPGTVADPQLTLFSGQTRIGENDNWGGAAALSAAFSSVGAFTLPSGSRDAALLVTLQPGSYTVQVSGVGGTSGVALIEVYEVP